MLGAAIVILAFAAGYGGRLLLADDDGGSSEITLEQAQGVSLGISRPGLVNRLGGTSPTVTRSDSVGRTCLFYALADRPDTAWEFCFAAGKLSSSESATGR